MTAQYSIIDENGDEIISARTIRACALLQGVSPKRIADRDCCDMNATDGGGFKVQRVVGKG